MFLLVEGSEEREITPVSLSLIPHVIGYSTVVMTTALHIKYPVMM